jgi:hypothetical protein
LVVTALNMALFTRKPESVIHHSDQGSQYTSIVFGNRCADMGVRPSMGTVGDAYDNAMAESFFATLECELIDRRVWKTHAEARLAIFTWIESWYNPRRRHSGIGQMSPIHFEKQHAIKKEKPNPQPNQEPNQTTTLAPQTQAGQHRLPTGCFAPVDKTTDVPYMSTSSCPQASPVDNPAPVPATYHYTTTAHLMENTPEDKNL